MTTKAGYYGSDDVDNRFPVPALKGTRSAGEKYFVLVNKETGQKEVYNEEFGADKLVGSYDKGGEFVPNTNWWGGAQPEEKKFFNSDEGKKLVNGHAQTVAYKGIREEQGLDPDAAKKKANDLARSNNAKEEEEQLTKSRAALSSSIAADKNTRNSFPKMIFYPITLRQEMQDVIKFDMMKYEPKDVGGDRANATITFSERSTDIDGRSIGSVLLPIPGGISDSNQVSWNQENMDPVAIAKATVAIDTILKGGEGLVDSVGGIANTLKNQPGVKEGVANVLAGAASGTGSQLLTRRTGAVLNPNMELLFQGPQLRDFTFQFKLSPRSKEEGERIIEIIRFFKQGMAPIRSKSRLFLKSPHTFKLQYLHENRDHKALNKFKECALQSCTVAYGEAQYSTYEDGVLSSYNMQLSFKELEPVFNDEYTILDNNQDTMLGY
tara:strand:+ start:357 stop:1667 length:1311 start_codon:yes stop_codon:yes gene_type:complete